MALEGKHYCLDHQGNDAHYDTHNCLVCQQNRYIQELEKWQSLVRFHSRDVAGAVDEYLKTLDEEATRVERLEAENKQLRDEVSALRYADDLFRRGSTI